MHMSMSVHIHVLQLPYFSPPVLHPMHNTSSEILWQCVLCRHEITSQKFFKGRTGAQTSEGSRIEPKLIHYMCCICLPLKSPEHSGCLSRSLFLTLWLQTTSRLPCLDLSKKLPLSLSFFDTLPLLGRHASVPHVLQMNSNIQYSKVYSIWVYFRIKAVQVQDFDIHNVISSLVVSLWA